VLLVKFYNSLGCTTSPGSEHGGGQAAGLPAVGVEGSPTAGPDVQNPSSCWSQATLEEDSFLFVQVSDSSEGVTFRAVFAVAWC
jgi:hypothetical protein